MSIGRGGIRVHSGGDITVEGGGRLVAQDDEGIVFAVDSEPAAIVMRKELIASLSREIFAEAIRSAEAPDEVIVTDTDGAFVDAPDDLGPEITDVEISSTGRALVFVSALLSSAPTGENGKVTCYMGYRLSGATVREASTATAVQLSYTRGDGTATLHPGTTIAATKTSLVDGLSAGLYTFTAQYRVDEFNEFDEGAYLFRNLTVIPF